MSKRHRALSPMVRRDTNPAPGSCGHSSGCAWGVSLVPSGLEADGVAGNMLQLQSLCLSAKVLLAHGMETSSASHPSGLES